MTQEEIIEQAKTVCQWVGWIGDPRAAAEVRKLKEMIEEFTGKEMLEYT